MGQISSAAKSATRLHRPPPSAFLSSSSASPHLDAGRRSAAAGLLILSRSFLFEVWYPSPGVTFLNRMISCSEDVLREISLNTVGSINSKDTAFISADEESRASVDIKDTEKIPEIFLTLKSCF
ncbi:hypothetical protein Dsin_018735 [Dipteronia sinensis]|uniref:Uncharacterized protein n=1 Tax=Dipteronia sinensis TaxID=43782 RepID=A0AAE0E3D2_9ROSI|nr:hypothetical protein Dsin_018735 [Dipteronia sinensis]